MFPESIGVTGADYTWDNNSGTVTLSNPIGAVNITITCAEIPQLAPAVVSIDGNELHIRDSEGIATFFNILVDGVAKDSVSKTGGTTTLVYDLTKLELPVGEHTITVIAEAEGYVNSETSTPVVYVVAPPILTTPVIQFNGDVLNITDADGKATSFDILVNGEVVQSVSAGNATFDFSTLNLPVGTYSVTVKAKADGYVDSEASSTVTYTVVPRIYSITTTLNGCSASSDNATEISENGTTTLRFELQNGYTFPASINVTGAEYVWDSNIGTVELRNPTGAVSVTIACVEVPKPQLDPAVIELDGDILKIYDMIGLATSATIFVNGEAVQVVNRESNDEEPLDPEFNHYGVIPEGCCLEICDINDEVHTYHSGDPFPAPEALDEAQWCRYDANGNSYGYDDYDEVENGWSFDEIFMGSEAPEIRVLESIVGIPVTALSGLLWHIGGHDTITKLTIPKSITYINLQNDSQMMPNGYPNLSSITYLGTMAEWNSITFAENWNYDCPEITVTCTDGTITIPAYNA
jgi:hypothetical protein